MYLHPSTTTLILLTALTSHSSAFMVTSYSGRQCRSQNLGQRVVVPSSGCQNDFAGVAASATLSGDASDANYFMVYFEGEDCDPDKVLVKGDLAKDWKSDCVEPKTSYGSFRVIDVCEKAGCLD